LEQQLAFLVGLIDGDGTVTPMDKERTGFHIGLCGASLPTLEWAQKLIDSLKLPNISNRDQVIKKRDGENCYYYSVGGVEAAFLFNLLKTINVPKLDRKWNNPIILTCVESLMRRWDNSPRNPENSNNL
jgi:hypothetical protein